MINEFIQDNNILDDLLRIIVICFGTLGTVYIAGRLLEILKSDRSKNTFAVFCLFGLSYAIVYTKHPNLSLSDVLWDTFIYGALSAIPYVILGWRLFSRTDSFLDRKGWKDKKRKRKK